jgi:hypothetical protein
MLNLGKSLNFDLDTHMRDNFDPHTLTPKIESMFHSVSFHALTLKMSGQNPNE